MLELPELMSIKELQQYLHIGKEKAYELAKGEGFLSFKLWGRYYILKGKFLLWLDKLKMGTK